MRVAAQWIYSKEGYDDLPSDPNWIGIGFGISDLGLLPADRRHGRCRTRGAAGLGGDGRRRDGRERDERRLAAVAVALLLVVYLVAIWAMTTKPT